MSISQQKEQNHIFLGGTTAAAAAMVNVAGVMVFFAYTANITGHVATLAEELVKGHWYQTSIVFIWLFLFFMGSFTAQSLVSLFEENKPYLSHAAPILLEVVILLIVGIYGHLFYHESLRETELLVACLIFCMGLQNGMVATISANKVKTTHLTGLITDLGREVSSALLKKNISDELMSNLKLHATILFFYVIGGILGGYFFLMFDFQVFYLVASLLAFVLYYDFNNR